MKKHIGFLIMNFNNKGGTERVTSVIANELIKKGYQVTIFSCQNGLNNIYKTDPQIKIKSLYGEQFKFSILRKYFVYKNLKHNVINSNIDIMIAVDVSLYFYLYPLQIKKLCKCIAWEHFNFFVYNNFLGKVAKKFSARYADCLIVLGKNDFHNYTDNCNKIKKMMYIYNPVTVQSDKKTNLSKKRVIAAGRLSIEKGFDNLIEAWRIIEKKAPDWNLDIFGDGELKGELINQVNKYGLKNIDFRGFASNIEEEYLNSSIFVLTSKFEGFVLVLIEAMSIGLPCVSFCCKEGPAEIIENNVNGFLVEQDNVEQLADKLLLLMNDEEKLISFSKNTQKDLNRFDLENVITRWVDLIESL